LQYKDFSEKLEVVSPKKLSRLALLPLDKRNKVMQADVEGRKENISRSMSYCDLAEALLKHDITKHAFFFFLKNNKTKHMQCNAKYCNHILHRTTAAI
jgi:hypothetical protein